MQRLLQVLLATEVARTLNNNGSSGIWANVTLLVWLNRAGSLRGCD
jgi:hypothetical protein